MLYLSQETPQVLYFSYSTKVRKLYFNCYMVFFKSEFPLQLGYASSGIESIK